MCLSVNMILMFVGIILVFVTGCAIGYIVASIIYKNEGR